MKTLKYSLDLSERILAALCVTSFVSMFVLGLTTVFFRFVIQSSLAFPDEMIRYLFVWIIALGTAIALRRNLHAAIGLFVDKMPGQLKRLTLLFSTICTASFFVIIVVKGTEFALRAAHQVSPAMEVSMAWVYAALPIGASFALIYVIELIVLQITKPLSVLISDDH